MYIHKKKFWGIKTSAQKSNSKHYSEKNEGCNSSRESSFTSFAIFLVWLWHWNSMKTWKLFSFHFLVPKESFSRLMIGSLETFIPLPYFFILYIFIFTLFDCQGHKAKYKMKISSWYCQLTFSFILRRSQWKAVEIKWNEMTFFLFAGVAWIFCSWCSFSWWVIKEVWVEWLGLLRYWWKFMSFLLCFYKKHEIFWLWPIFRFFTNFEYLSHVEQKSSWNLQGLY